jgi:hypothetical protein
MGVVSVAKGSTSVRLVRELRFICSIALDTTAKIVDAVKLVVGSRDGGHRKAPWGLTYWQHAQQESVVIRSTSTVEGSCLVRWSQ